MVTGGAGFIGSTLVDRLLAEGHAVDVVDDLSSGSLTNLADARSGSTNDMTFHHLDIRSPQLVDLMARRPPEVVFHLAAQADVRVSVNDPVLDADINILGSLRVLEGARRAGVSKIVFAASGGTLYGDVRPSDLPARESLPQIPMSPYGVSKMAVVDYLKAYRELHNIEFCALALANVYGPRQDPHGEAGVVAIFAGHLVAGERCTIFGDGSQTRDFVFVDDVVDAMARAGQRGGGLLINVGTGTETSVLRLYETMASEAGSSQRPVHAPARPGELQRSALDPGRAAIHLGWKPWTSLAEGTAAVLAATSPGAGGGGRRRPAKGGRGSGQRNRSSR
ncbi:MAG TPA: NAD-dependent epimerase/dehydratase family protein [Acidimicrobiales bacterium]|jgi:UDP-glucose 4-epimerase|nr:NAD-dependent epimerase/dehydratase family protein [Acidimicrobiales bacterium]